MKNGLVAALGTALLLAMPMGKVEAHEPVYYDNGPSKVSVSERTDVYRTHYYSGDVVKKVTHVDIVEKQFVPHESYAESFHVHTDSCGCLTRGCEAGPHYVRGEPVRNTLKFIFCPRCHRQHAQGTLCSCGFTVPVTRGCEAGPHYIPGRPVGNALKFIFCPRCHRQHAQGTLCSCGFSNSTTRGCAAGPHYVPGEPVRNTLKAIFCPRCHREMQHCCCGGAHGSQVNVHVDNSQVDVYYRKP